MVAVQATALVAAPLAPDSPPAAQSKDVRTEVARLRDEAFRLAYNLDHEQGVALLRKALALAPDDAGTHRALAGLLWLQVLFRRGAVTVDHYLGGLTRASVDLPKPPPELDDAFRRHVQRAEDIARGRVERTPRDAQAHYELGAALGLKASYTASVEGRLLAGFRAARGAFDAHERVLELDPRRKDAGLTVGTYRYIVAALSLPVRWMAYVAGFGGGRERGIRLIEEAAAYPGETSTEAKFALVLVYNREKRYDDALAVLRQLRREYPRNRLVVLEEGATALRAGRAVEAERILTEGIARLAGDPRPRIPGEEALWHLKRASARLLVKNTAGALADLRVAQADADAPRWIRGRVQLELGRIADLRGDRAAAVAHYREARALCESDRDTRCARDAAALLARPYRYD
ncbi:MAG TPA: tetratricopeptide repeat protein [Vicinamibacterales bacterium]|nr:tetratricopeptide repeat protein [Vicinamibacterales bacterium]